MLKFSKFVSLLIYNGIFLALAVVVYMIAMNVLEPNEPFIRPFFIAFCSVYLAGLTSLAVIYAIRKMRQNNHDAIAVLFGTLVRTGIAGTAILFVIVTQEKKVAFFMLCFSIVFYLALIPLNVWLTSLPGEKKQGP